MMRRLRPLRGQALLETALIAPLMLLFIVGIIQAGLIFQAYDEVLNASREGARAAAQYRYNYDYSTAQNDSNRETGAGVSAGDSYADNARAAANAALGTDHTSSPTVTVVYPDGYDSSNPSRGGQRVKVTVAYPYTMPIVSSLGFLPSTVTLRAATTAMIRRS